MRRMCSCPPTSVELMDQQHRDCSDRMTKAKETEQLVATCDRVVKGKCLSALVARCAAQPASCAICPRLRFAGGSRGHHLFKSARVFPGAASRNFLSCSTFRRLKQPSRKRERPGRGEWQATLKEMDEEVMKSAFPFSCSASGGLRPESGQKGWAQSCLKHYLLPLFCLSLVAHRQFVHPFCDVGCALHKLVKPCFRHNLQ